MAENKKKEMPVLFTKENFKWMLIGIVVIAIGMMLMAGGKSDDTNVFNFKEVYSTRRITVAPIVILLGLAIEIFAIFKKPKKQQAAN
ncbi:DUF3098 domain-containing protein [Rhizosphaericola mali]|uniref:DUF3098 domain-containing protein n=1 Tax=Rhizosphaericola mali TaxID=2545455 RepID=A0A5P2FXM8_9BACT|nr:DUF3098 domain-containing protein [Rhizosphaericola mali]QES87697.1 DUF3098 domain-containing protein [Rhizosphaericola mali]